VLDWASAQGITRVTLLADMENKTARDFYRKLGFADSHMRVMRKQTG
jgi:ribosomal protein S18 acetylase RimI-like enzyme